MGWGVGGSLIRRHLISDLRSRGTRSIIHVQFIKWWQASWGNFSLPICFTGFSHGGKKEQLWLEIGHWGIRWCLNTFDFAWERSTKTRGCFYFPTEWQRKQWFEECGLGWSCPHSRLETSEARLFSQERLRTHPSLLAEHTLNAGLMPILVRSFESVTDFLFFLYLRLICPKIKAAKSHCQTEQRGNWKLLELYALTSGCIGLAVQWIPYDR